METNDNNSNKEYDIIQIGHNKTDKIYFCGEIGPFFLLKNLEGDLNNISRIIKEIMKLKDKYPDFIYLMNKEANYDFSYLNNYKYYSNTNKEQMYKELRKELDNLKLECNIQCELYISPFILKCYNDFEEQDLDKYYLRAIPYICENEKYVNIYELKVSLIESCRNEVDFSSLDIPKQNKVLYGFRYGENTERINKKTGESTIIQKAVDFYGNKERVN